MTAIYLKQVASASFYLLFLVLFIAFQIHSHAIRPQKRDYSKLPDSSLPTLAKLSNPSKYLDFRNPSTLLSRILIPRPPDTENNTFVRQQIINVFQNDLVAASSADSGWKGHGKMGWHIETPSYTVDTPEGKKKMTNIVVTKNPAAPRKLVVAAHFDSKYFSVSSGMSGFVGATDSAVPCAILADLAAALDDALDARERKIHANQDDDLSRSQETTLQFVFFDGEEAYRVWTHQDSIYGARELANQWSTTFWSAADYQNSSAHAPKLASRRYHHSYGPVRHMDTIEHLILLDLLGAPDPEVPSYFHPTQWFHEAMMDTEKRLKQAGVLFPSDVSESFASFFNNHPRESMIEDDHLPFLYSGVPVLHVIPMRFPTVWHTLADDVSALHYPTIHAWSMIIRLLVAEYLELDLSSSSIHRQTDQQQQQKSESITTSLHSDSRRIEL